MKQKLATILLAAGLAFGPGCATPGTPMATKQEVKNALERKKGTEQEKALWDQIDKGKRTLSDWQTKCNTKKGKKQIIKEMKCIVELYMDYYNDNDEMMRDKSPCDKIKIVFAIQMVGDLIAEDLLQTKEGKKGSRGNQANKIIQDNQDTIISKIVATTDSDIGRLEKRPQ